MKRIIMENKFPNLGIIIQARTGSTRMPNKMVTPFYQDMTLFELLVSRIKIALPNMTIILATSSSEKDDILERYAKNIGLLTFRGNEENVLERFICAAEEFNITKIIRVCADNPLLDLDALKYQIEQFSKKDVDYWCYSLRNGTPSIKTHYGFWTEAVKLEALKKIRLQTVRKDYLEHVTNYIYENENQFSIHYEPISPLVECIDNIRLTIDTEADFQLTKEVYQEIISNKIPPVAYKIVEFINTRNDWREIMKLQIGVNLK
jgi:spore coat polysaccharide biosynthesis protein SpsF